jgi:serine/threonine protein phosphatase 1
MADNEIFARLSVPRRIWAIGSVHGEVDRLRDMHRIVLSQFADGDRLVYLGNFMGRSESVRAVIDEMLRVRRKLLARPGMIIEDIVFLRGSQEEMWQKVLQLQFAPNPREVLPWVINQGVGATIQAYGGNLDEGLRAVRDGAVSITRWTNALRTAVRNAPGHGALMSALRRAALTDDGAVLLVNAGIDISRPLTAQSDSFWWGGTEFSAIDRPYGEVRRIVRGFDRAKQGAVDTEFTLSLDGGCGRGGKLLAGLLRADGRVQAIYEA